MSQKPLFLHDILQLFLPRLLPHRLDRVNVFLETGEFARRRRDVGLDRLEQLGFGRHVSFGHVVLERLDGILQLLDLGEHVLTTRIELGLARVNVRPRTADLGARELLDGLRLRTERTERLLGRLHKLGVELPHDPEISSEILDFVELGLEIVHDAARVLGHGGRTRRLGL